MRGAIRTSAEFDELVFTGLELVEPGVVLVSEWRPEDGRAAAAVRGEHLRRRGQEAVTSAGRAPYPRPAAPPAPCRQLSRARPYQSREFCTPGSA